MPEGDAGEWLGEQVDELAERATGSIEKAARIGADPASTGAREVIEGDERENLQLMQEASEEARAEMRRPRPGFWGQALEWAAGVAVVAGLIAVPYALGWRPARSSDESEGPPAPKVVVNMGTLPSDEVYEAIDSVSEVEASFTALVALSSEQETEMKDRLKAYKQGRFFAANVPSTLAGLEATLLERRAEVPVPGEVATAGFVPVVEAKMAEVMALAPLDLRETIVEQIEQAYHQEVETRQRGGLDLPKGIDFGPGFGSFRFR